MVVILVSLADLAILHGQEFENGVAKNMIRIKLKPSLAKSVNIKRSTLNQIVSTGIDRLDKMHMMYSATDMVRVFPYSPRYEERHKKYGLDLWYTITFRSGVSSAEAAKSYASLEEVERSEVIHQKKFVDGSGMPVYLPPIPTSRGTTMPFNDPYLPKQWHYNNTGQTGGTMGSDIDLFDAWKITTGSPSVIVSIHDMGVDVKHEDLAGMMWVNTPELNGKPGVDDDGNGYIDDINGFNFTNNSGTIDAGYHATHVAGTIAAENNNGIGVSGIAGGSGKGDGVRIMSCEIMGGQHSADVAESYVYAADNGALISQNSWGYDQPNVYEQTVLDAIDYFIAEAGNYPGSLMKGGVVIFAAGNSGWQDVSYPGAYASCIAVSALNAEDKKASYSNYGSWVDIAAPGGETEDDLRIGNSQTYSNGVLSTLDKNGYGYLDGTSMACPHVSGIAALIISKYGGSNFTNADLRKHLLTGVRDIYSIAANSSYMSKLGSGAADAVLALANDNKIAPAKIPNLALSGIAQDFATLNWTVPSDADDARPISFEIIVSTEDITLAKLPYARILTMNSKDDAGTPVSFEVSGLQALTTYHFAVRSIDRWGNVSDFSNLLEATTNKGPQTYINPGKSTLQININVPSNSIGKDSITLINQGEGVLRWGALARHINAVPLSTKPMLNYPLQPNPAPSCLGIKGSGSFSLSPVPQNNIQHDTSSEKGYVNPNEPLMVFGETNLQVTNSSATRFFVDDSSGFNLTGADVYLQVDTATGPVILEVYGGYDISTAHLLLAQPIHAGAMGYYTHIDLSEQIYFEKGSYFWLVFHVPAGNRFPLGGGVELHKDDSRNCYISLNGGKSWKLFEEAYYDNSIVWAVYAMSQYVKLDQYVKLQPDSGVVAPGGNVRMVASVDASNMMNGKYTGNVVINTNETGKPMIRVPVTVEITGHTPRISTPQRIDFGGVLLGKSKDLVIELKNTGLGRFLPVSPYFSFSNSQFGYIQGITSPFEAGTVENITFRFTPAQSGNVVSRVTVYDANGNNYSFDLFGYGIDPPVVSLNPAKTTFDSLSIGTSISGQFTLSNKGKYPLDYYLPSFADGSNMTNIPSDIPKFGYTAEVDTTGSLFSWQDISSTGTEITSMFTGNTDVNVFYRVALNFLFPFFGKNENFVYVSKYGVLAFTNNNTIWSASPMSYKASNNPDRYISGCGFPMLFQEAGFGKVYFRQEPDKFIVQYQDVPMWDGVGFVNNDYLHPIKASVTFQVVLSDEGNITLYYKDCSIPEYSKEHFTLIAIEDKTKKDGLLVHGIQWPKFDHVMGNFTYKPNSTVRFINPGLGLFSDVTNPYGSILPGDSVKVTYKIKTDSLYALPYHENLVVITNDPVNNPSIHTAAFNITKGGTSQLTVDSTFFDFGTLFQGSSGTRTLLLSNTGKASDSLISAVFDHNYFSLKSSLPVNLKPERAVPCQIVIHTSSTGNFSDTLRITSRKGQVMVIALKGKIIQGPILNIQNASNAPLTSITKINVPAGTDASGMVMRIRNSGQANLLMTATNNDFTTISEAVVSDTLLPDYSWKSSLVSTGTLYDWIEIAEDGSGKKITGLNAWLGKEWTGGIKMPFSFNYYGKTYDSLYIGISGLITFTPGQNKTSYFFGGGDIPDTLQPNNFIAPLFIFGGPDDINQYPLSGAYYQLLDDKVIVEYRDYNSNFVMGDPVSFEVILYQSGRIKFQYKMPASTVNLVTNQGVIGIENEDGTRGIQISSYQTFVNSDMAIGLYPVTYHSVAPGQSKDFNVTLSAKELVAGSYADSMLVMSNDPLALQSKIPVRLVVSGTAAIGIPDSVAFGDLIFGSAGTCIQSFDIKNTGTANYTVSSVTQHQPDSIRIEAWVRSGDFWVWTPVQQDIFPRTIAAKSSLKMRAVVTPKVPGSFIDTLVLNATGLPSAAYRIPLNARIFNPPVIGISPDTITVYAQSPDLQVSRWVIVNNTDGGYPLQYNTVIDYERDTAAMASTSTGIPGRINDYGGPAPFLLSEKIGDAASTKSFADMDDFRRILKHDTATLPQTKLGYGGGRTFLAATSFTAPADGFNLTHVQTWYVPGDWLQSKIKVDIYSGDKDINNAHLLYTETFTSTIPAADQKGRLMTFQLATPIKFFPNETFFIVFEYESGAAYPQGSVMVSIPKNGMFMFGAGEGWYDITSQGSLASYGWMVRAVENAASDKPWVMLASADSMTLAPGACDSIKLDFNAATANPGDNFANLMIRSNDIKHPAKQVVLHLRRNEGPQFDVANPSFTVLEGDTLRFSVSATDLEGDYFTLSMDSSYQYLQVENGETTVNNANGLTTESFLFTYTPGYSSSGVHIFNITGTDILGNVSHAYIHMNVINLNRLPSPIARDTIRLRHNGNYFLVHPRDIFTDQDMNDALTMDVNATDPSVVTLFASRSDYLLYGAENGITEVTFTVTDPYGAMAINTIPVKVTDELTASENISAGEFRIYPNPTAGKVWIALPGNVKGALRLTIVNSLGETVLEKQVDAHDARVIETDLAGYPSGLYLIRVVNGYESATFKINKQ